MANPFGYGQTYTPMFQQGQSQSMVPGGGGGSPSPMYQPGQNAQGLSPNATPSYSPPGQGVLPQFGQPYNNPSSPLADFMNTLNKNPMGQQLNSNYQTPQGFRSFDQQMPGQFDPLKTPFADAQGQWQGYMNQLMGYSNQYTYNPQMTSQFSIPQWGQLQNQDQQWIANAKQGYDQMYSRYNQAGAFGIPVNQGGGPMGTPGGG